MSYPSTRPLWVYLILNGDSDPLHSVKVNIGGITDIPQLFALASDKLRISEMPQAEPLERVFSQEGIEIFKMDQIYPDDRLYFASKDEPFLPTAANKQSNQQNDPNDPANTNANDGYLYTAALYTSAIVSTTYGAFSHAVRTHAPQQVVNSFASFEDTVQYYSQPVAQSTIPYISSSVTWTDQMLNQAIETTTHKTNEFLLTEAGQKVVALKDNVGDFAAKAVLSFQAATTEPHDGDTSSDGSAQQQTYLTYFKQSAGTAWNDSLLPFAKAAFHMIGTQVVPQAQAQSLQSLQSLQSPQSPQFDEGGSQLQDKPQDTPIITSPPHGSPRLNSNQE